MKAELKSCSYRALRKRVERFPKQRNFYKRTNLRKCYLILCTALVSIYAYISAIWCDNPVAATHVSAIWSLRPFGPTNVGAVWSHSPRASTNVGAVWGHCPLTATYIATIWSLRPITHDPHSFNHYLRRCL